MRDWAKKAMDWLASAKGQQVVMALLTVATALGLNPALVAVVKAGFQAWLTTM